MSSEKLADMNSNISKRVKFYLIAFTLIFITIFWSDYLVKLITESVTDKDKAELTSKIISSSIIIVTSIILFLLTLGRDLDLHNFLDSKVFKAREKTANIIHTNIIEAADSIGFKDSEKMRNQWTEVSNLFYHFVNDQKVLRDLAFTYWEQYFVNIYVITSSTVFFTISLIIVIYRYKFDFSVSIPIIYLIVGLAIELYTKKKLIEKLYRLPVQQINEIKNVNKREFIEQLNNRFGNKLFGAS